MNFKKLDWTQLFIIKPKYPGRLGKTDMEGKKLSGNPNHMRQNATTVTWSEHFKISCRVIGTQYRPRVH